MNVVDAGKPRLAVQAFWLLVAKTTSFLITLALPVLLVRLFDPREFGSYRLALVLATSSTSILAFSVGVSAFYFLPRLAEDARKALIFNIVTYHLIGGGAVITALILWPGLLVAITGAEAIGSLAPLIGLTIATILFAAFFETIATANQDVWHSTAFIVLAQLTRGITILAAAFLFRTVAAVLWAWIIQGVFQSLALLWYLHYRFPYFWRYRSREVTVEQMRYVGPLGLTSLLIVVQLDIHNYIVSHFFSTAQYAFYAVGTAQIPLIAILRDSISSVMQSRMSKLQQDNETGAMLRLMLRAWRTLAMAFIPLFAGLLVLASDFVTALYTPKYASSIPIFQLNLSLLILSIFVTDSVVRAFAQHRFWFLRVRLGLLIGQLALSFVLVPRIGMIGALTAVVATMVLDRILNIRLVLRTLGFDKRGMYIFHQLGWLSILSALAAGITYLFLVFSPMHSALVRLLGGVVVFALSYLTLILATGFLNEEERGFLQTVIHRSLRILRPGYVAR